MSLRRTSSAQQSEVNGAVLRVHARGTTEGGEDERVLCRGHVTLNNADGRLAVGSARRHRAQELVRPVPADPLAVQVVRADSLRAEARLVWVAVGGERQGGGASSRRPQTARISRIEQISVRCSREPSQSYTQQL